MSNIFNFILKGDGEEREGEGSPPQNSAGPPVPQLTKEQMRARRLGKLIDPVEKSADQGEEDNDSSGADKTSSTKRKAGDVSIEAAVPMDVAPDGGTSPIAIKTSQNPPASTTVPTLLSNPSHSPSPQVSPKAETPNTPKKSERVLNNALENSFLFSLRPASAVMGSSTGMLGSGLPITYMGSEGVGMSSTMLNSVNLTEALMERLMDDSEKGVGSTINYLVQSYKRILTKESTLSADIREEFLSCKAQCINFIVTALTDPDTFSPNSDNASQDLIQILKDDSSQHMNSLLKDLASELDSRKGDVMQAVVNELVTHCFDALHVAPKQQDPMTMLMNGGRPQPPTWSVLDTSVTPPMIVLRSLCRGEPRFAKIVAEHGNFQLNPTLVTAQPAQSAPIPPANIFSQFGASPAQPAGPAVVQGAAVAELTLCGRMLRHVIDARCTQFQQMFQSALTMTERQTVIEGNMNTVRANANNIQQSVFDILFSVIKGGKEAKAAAMKFIRQTIVCNAENDKDQPNPMIASSRGMLLNLAGVLLRLCEPFLSNEDKLAKIDWRFLSRPENKDVFAHDATGLSIQVVAPQWPLPSGSAHLGSNAFMTESLFLTCRVLHLSYAPMIRDFKQLGRQVSHYRQQIQEGDPRAQRLLLALLALQTECLDEKLVELIVDYCCAMCSVLLKALIEAGGGADSMPTETIIAAKQFTPAQAEILSAIPEYMIADIFEMLNFVADWRGDKLDTPFMSHVLDLIVFFLRRPTSVLSPHLRATFGLTLFYGMLPGSARNGDNAKYSETHATFKDGRQCSLIDSDMSCQRYLAPCLLLLYGDVERTGHYEKIDHRRKLGKVLKYLWSLPSHRAAFRDIANAADSSGDSSDGDTGVSMTEITPGEGFKGSDNAEAWDSNYFIRFANGVMNETNLQVNEALTSLATVREIQELQKSAEWAAMSEEQRKEKQEKLEEGERDARMCSGLCMDTIHMVNFLTTDEAIIKPFLTEEILPRFTSMLLNMVNNLTGKKSRELKVDNMEKYDFHPKDMLREVCEIMLHVCSYPEFVEAVVKNGYYLNGVPLEDAISIVSKHGLVTQQNKDALVAFRQSTKVLETKARELDKLLEEAPSDFLDPLLATLMEDPVLLRTSSTVVDKATISQQMLNEAIDPFNRAPITQADIVPQPDLKAKIQAWLADAKTKAEEMAAKAAKELS